MSDFWEFPTVSMGIGPMNAIYQAQFNKYLHNRGIKDTSEQRVWAYLGDGEMDEPESRGLLQLAAGEELDNLTFVVNCNLQRLDGPVRGNGKIIQELEAFFRGAGWNVIKVVWGRGWDPLLAADGDGALVHLMNSTSDGDYQTFRANDGKHVREKFFDRDPRTRKMVADWSDDDIWWKLKRGGHDYRKVYAAYKAATEHTGQPTVILAKTIKGYGLGPDVRRPQRDAPDEEVHPRGPQDLPRQPPDPDQRRAAREGPLQRPLLPPGRRRRGHPVRPRAPGQARWRCAGASFEAARAPARRLGLRPGQEGLRQAAGRDDDGLRPAAQGPHAGQGVRPADRADHPDEARTFGMDSFFSTIKIYNPHGQNYTPVDAELMLAYREAKDGQILHLGINEAGSVAAFTAAGTSYATHGQPMIPIYVFYSMFGFQRTGDSIWAAADQMTRGFLIGATAGRTTLTGEGLQHADGHSPLLASTNPAVVHYDPAFAYEIAHIVQDGLHRMYGTDDSLTDDQRNVIYYLTVYNEPMAQPAEPEERRPRGPPARHVPLRRGAAEGLPTDAPAVRLLASGVGMPWALEAQELLRNDWHVVADVWSVTSWNELRRDGLRCDEGAFLTRSEAPVPWVTQKLADRPGPVVAVSDYMRAVQDQIRQWVPGDFASLGADGFGFSDTRPPRAASSTSTGRRWPCAALTSLADRGEVDRSVPLEAARRSGSPTSPPGPRATRAATTLPSPSSREHAAGWATAVLLDHCGRPDDRRGSASPRLDPTTPACRGGRRAGHLRASPAHKASHNAMFTTSRGSGTEVMACRAVRRAIDGAPHRGSRSSSRPTSDRVPVQRSRPGLARA